MNLKMDAIEKSCADIEHNFFLLYLNLEFHQLDSRVRRAYGKKDYKRILKAMRRPVALTEEGEAVLEMYEDHVSFLFTAQQGHHAEC